jgi:hypothetical protein
VRLVETAQYPSRHHRCMATRRSTLSRSPAGQNLSSGAAWDAIEPSPAAFRT